MTDANGNSIPPSLNLGDSVSLQNPALTCDREVKAHGLILNAIFETGRNIFPFFSQQEGNMLREEGQVRKILTVLEGKKR